MMLAETKQTTTRRFLEPPTLGPRLDDEGVMREMQCGAPRELTVPDMRASRSDISVCCSLVFRS